MFLSEAEAELFIEHIDTYQASTLSAHSDGPHVSFDNDQKMALYKYLTCFEQKAGGDDKDSNSDVGLVLKSNLNDNLVSNLGKLLASYPSSSREWVAYSMNVNERK